MRQTYTPQQVMEFTEDDLGALVGKYVDITIAADARYWFDPACYDGPWEGGAGVCVSVAVTGDVHRGRTINVAWDWGMAWSWIDGQAVYVSVCDEHGDHTSLNGVVCVETLGPAARAAGGARR